MPSNNSQHPRFVLLDGLRGIAALFIIQRHAPSLLGDELPSSYLGVDLFFALSGFVLAHAYGAAIADQWISALAFMKMRLFRLYPLYGLALFLMTTFFITLWLSNVPTPLDDLHRPIDLQELAIALVTGLLFIPAPFSLTLNGALFLVHPAWSLFNELVANIVYGLWGARARTKHLLIVVAVSAVVLVFAAAEFGRLHAGFRWSEMHAGMARVFFSFFVGVLIYRLRSRLPKVQPLVAIGCLAFVILILAFPTPKPLKAYFDLFVVVFCWPGLLLVASRCVPDPVTGKISAFLGTASYAVYVLHVPLLAWTEHLLPHITDSRAIPYAGLVLMAAITAVSWYVTVHMDQPLQRWFKNRLRRPQVFRPISDSGSTR
ncbi:acyltransferase [Rhizobium deserti]|uniref:Acyltransferase n=1 Tax=Rhizobium deserti TaxID=2547961 RepID=A0A4R5UIC8_9HYPH|nr:acyltransferase [Rhizobium deserti]TDK36560.1 acyltransferase [Rhizobium deserti]